MTAGELDAIEAFERLGLTTYEARVFIGLQRLGSGTAREIADVADVPRSQVYSAADELEERGLIESQNASPLRYRPVSVEEAKSILEQRFETEQDRAFGYVERVATEPDGTEQQEDVWTVRGTERVTDRLLGLLSEARSRVFFGVRVPWLLSDDIVHRLERCGTQGIDVTVVSRSAEVRERCQQLSGVSVFEPPNPERLSGRSGRILMVDERNILLSVVDENDNETAIWSGDSLFASVLIQLAEAGMEELESDV